MTNMDPEELRRLWDEGIARGPGHFRSIDDIKKEARRRAAVNVNVRKPRLRRTSQAEKT